MEIKIDDYVLNTVFYHREAGVVPEGYEGAGLPYDEFWYARTRDGDGWVTIWADGMSHHTYRDPAERYT